MDEFRTKIYKWYEQYKRELPWRETTAAYNIWLSEVILQQTRIDQGIHYYLKFVKNFPSVKDLASADEDFVLKLWQGLGYYSRARNLHYAAKQVVNEYRGIFPSRYSEIIRLKGVGEYTAAAIASISFNLPYPVVDGNVFRFLSRYFGIKSPIDTAKGKKDFKELTRELITEYDPGMHNQAMMEFGALQCTPAKPDCESCVFADSCHALQNHQISQLPVKSKKIKQRNRYFNYLVINNNGSVFIRKRTKNDIWKNLYEFPLIETSEKMTIKKILEQENLFHEFDHLNFNKVSEWKQHLLSHQKIHYRFLLFATDLEKMPNSELIKVDKKDIFNFAVPKLLEVFISNNEWEE